MSDQGGLFGPDVSDTPVDSIEQAGDRIDVWSRQFVNRWVLLPHQRQVALVELRELISEARKQ